MSSKHHDPQKKYTDRFKEIAKAVAIFESQLNEHHGVKLRLKVMEYLYEPVHADAILRAVAQSLSVPTDEILGNSRLAHILDARHIACYLMRRHIPDATFEFIADKMNMNHASVIYACEKVRSFLEMQDALYIRKITKIEREHQELFKI